MVLQLFSSMVSSPDNVYFSILPADFKINRISFRPRETVIRKKAIVSDSVKKEDKSIILRSTEKRELIQMK